METAKMGYTGLGESRHVENCSLDVEVDAFEIGPEAGRGRRDLWISLIL